MNVSESGALAEPATILIVDDDSANLEALSEFLRAMGYAVTTAVDGEDALEQVRLTQPDLVLLDILLPRLDGLQVCRRLKLDPATYFLPIIIFTGMTSTKHRIGGVEAGADDFLSKPINPLELVTRVKSLLRVKRLNDELEASRRDLERRVAERTSQLRHALEELRELDRLKSEFVGRVSHELRTPVSYLKGYLNLLADGALQPRTEDWSRGLENAVRAARHLERLVDDVVDLDRTQIGPVAIEPVSVEEAVQEAVQMVQEAHAPHPVAIAVELPGTVERVLADRLALARCLRHLLDNAVKFSPPTATVELRAQPVEGNARLRFSVRDRGAGIPADELDKVFRDFYQVDGSATRRQGGTGVGLALVKLLLEAQQTTIFVETAEGQGSLFYFDLPVAQTGLTQ